MKKKRGLKYEYPKQDLCPDCGRAAKKIRHRIWGKGCECDHCNTWWCS